MSRRFILTSRPGVGHPWACYNDKTVSIEKLFDSCGPLHGSDGMGKERSMSSGNTKVVEMEGSMEMPENGDRPSSLPGFRMFNRVVDWITNDRMQLINITDRINEIVRKSGIRDGIVHLQSLHTTT